MSAAVRELFAGIARRYDLLNRVLSAGSDLRWRRQAIDLLDRPGGLVLDLACGTFDLGLDALARGRARRIIAGDFCLPMLQAGRGKICARPLAPLCNDAHHLPLADGCLDAVIMAYGWRNCDDPEAVLREIHRVLRPGGQLLLLEFFRPTRLWPRCFYATFGRLVFPLLGALLAGDAAAYSYLRRSIVGFYSRAEADRVVAATGFDRLRWRCFFGGISHAVHARRHEVPPAC
jgi:demethylmenaquinone methyltransferase/2-methoxy-6-polyprenyl-1,4-benzoquinol methylase